MTDSRTYALPPEGEAHAPTSVREDANLDATLIGPDGLAAGCWIASAPQMRPRKARRTRLAATHRSTASYGKGAGS